MTIEQKKADSSYIDRYNLFYVEAIMHDSSFPQINRIRQIFENITIDEFIDMVNKTIQANDYEVMQQFLYFLLLFRDMKHIQDHINSEKFSVDMLERLVFFTYGYCSLYDHSTERIIDEILYFLDNDKLLELVLQSKNISKDKLLLFFILSKFDIDMLNRYFKHIKNISEFINYFLNLPDEVLRSIISRNYHLFQYIMLMMAEGDSEQMVSSDFYNKFKGDIEQFSRLSDIIRQYKEKTDYEKDKLLPFHQRDMSRISFLVNMIKDLPDAKKAIDYFDSEHLFIDIMEKNIVYAVVTDPILKDTFKYYDSMFDIK